VREKIIEILDKHVETLSKCDTLTERDVDFLMSYLSKIEAIEHDKNFREKMNLIMQGGLS
jgi:hypothetical protein